MVKEIKGYGNEYSWAVIKDWCLWQKDWWFWWCQLWYFSSFFTLGKSQILYSWLSPNCQIHKVLVPIQAGLMWDCTLRRPLASVTSEIVSNYSSECGSLKEWSYISREVVLWTWQPCFSEPFIRLALGQAASTSSIRLRGLNVFPPGGINCITPFLWFFVSF